LKTFIKQLKWLKVKAENVNIGICLYSIAFIPP